MAMAACMLMATAGLAQSFPTKRVTIIQPYPPGGGGDAAARALAHELSEQWKQPVIVESKPGAGTTISAAYVAGMPPDGYVLLMTTTQLASAGALFKNLTYDYVKDFAPISLFGESPFILTVRPGLKVSSVQELLAEAKGKTLNYASSGLASIPHLAGAWLNKVNGLTAVHVPFQGTAPAFAALLGEQVDYLFGDVSVVPHVQSGRVKALAVTGPRRMSVLPQLPAMSELVPDFALTIWIALEAPAGTPRPVIETINAAVRKATSSPALMQRYAAAGREPRWTTPEQLRQFKLSEVRKYSALIADTGAKLE
jgi:tripartite-type tricarboxylate transporter receptor subunit TctC